MLAPEEVREESACSIVHIGADSILPSFNRITEPEVQSLKLKTEYRKHGFLNGVRQFSGYYIVFLIKYYFMWFLLFSYFSS